MEKFYLKNIGIDKDSYNFNQYIMLRRNPKNANETIVEISIENNINQNDIILFYRALQFGIPKVHVNSYAYEEGSVLNLIIESLSCRMTNYYSNIETKYSSVNEHKIIINEDDVNMVKKVFDILNEFSKKQIQEKENRIWKPTRWQYAYNQYVNACSSSSIESSILSIITGLESLLVNGNGELTYKVSLYSSIIASDDLKERKAIFDLIKGMYNIRSKVVHGEISSVVRKLSSDDIYSDYFRLKEIFIIIFMKLYNISEKEVFNKISDTIFSCPQYNI